MTFIEFACIIIIQKQELNRRFIPMNKKIFLLFTLGFSLLSAMEHPSSDYERLNRTLLSRASSSITEPMAIYELIGEGADVNTINENGDTPLLCALKSKNFDVAHILIHYHHTNIYHANQQGETALMFAIKHRQHELINELLNRYQSKDEKESLINVEDQKRKTPLIYAIENGLYNTVHQLINEGANITELPEVEGENGDKNTPLQTALLNDQYEIARLLINRGANLNVIFEEDATPLMLAISAKKPDLVRLMIEHGAPINDVNGPNSFTPLQLATEEVSLEIVQILIENGANTHVFWDVLGQDLTLLGIAAGGTLVESRTFFPREEFYLDFLETEAERLELMRWLIDEQGIAIDEGEQTALQCAAYMGLQNIVQFLLSRGANTTGVLASAVHPDNRYIVKYLLENGFIDHQNENGADALMNAALRNCPDIIKLLLEHGATFIETKEEGNLTAPALVAAITNVKIEALHEFIIFIKKALEANIQAGNEEECRRIDTLLHNCLTHVRVGFSLFFWRELDKVPNIIDEFNLLRYLCNHWPLPQFQKALDLFPITFQSENPDFRLPNSHRTEIVRHFIKTLRK
ncbi:MAG: hypothetical protein US03_C0007G0043 [candidate division TM6 bacterium GW2011_GWF2_36_131]|nr:MAG: hypothetical protein US03_C0007G0043 [candidate division TM6 bacterium GW2011_GWF2_36_131]KKQ19572.1 MAG: hypothetical protein US32_C0007G0025 [candidate division TM6 bacterium GW2011_GWA2_36_9]